MSASARQVYSFHGGIHPAENKLQSSQSPIKSLPLPPKLIVPVRQHIGNPAKVVVSVGDKVLKGETIAEADGFISVPVHAPTSGIVLEISESPIPHPSGLSDLCIFIEPDGDDTWCELVEHEDYAELSVQELQNIIRNAGVAGMGGAGFPTSVKMHPPKQDKVATLILNAAECEPYITADDRLLQERASEVIGGLEIMAYMLSPGECLVGIEDNKPEAIAALRKAAEGTRIEIVVVPTKYPSGGEKQLIKLLTDKEVPSGQIPADIGVVCQNVGSAAAVYRAVRHGEPLISRITTVTGEQVPVQGNAEVLMGTPISWLLEQFDYQAANPERVVMGGPMMGFALNNLEIPVVKTTNCILVPSASEMPLPEPAQACIRCGLCADACPAELLPQQLYWFARAQEHEKAEHHNLFDCIECGACSYVCPSSIPLVQYYRHAKGEIKMHRQEHEKSERARIRFETRQARQIREQEEKEAKRKARAEAAAKAQAAKKAAAEKEANESSKQTNTSVVEAALARTKQSPVATPQEESADIETLKTNWEKAQSKLDKMFDALETAKQENPDQVAKLTRAVEKNQMRVNQAKQAFENAESQQTQAKAENQVPEAKAEMQEEVDLETLKTNWDKAQSKLDKMLDALETAKQDNPEQVAKLTRAVEKNQVRVNAAKQAFEKAQSSSKVAEPQNETSSADKEEEPVDLEALKKALVNAQAKLEKMQDTLADAQNADPVQEETVAKMERAVAKNEVRVSNAQQALDEALAKVDAGDAQ